MPSFDLLNLPRPQSPVPWAYVKVAEGCDRTCGFCAIPSFRGKQRSRPPEILDEVEQLAAGSCSSPRTSRPTARTDRRAGAGRSFRWSERWRTGPRIRLLYLYPSELGDELVDVVCASSVPYFDLSLQHVSKPLLRRMRRWGDGDRFLRRIAVIRARRPDAALRTNFIVGYPGETEDDHDALLRFVEEAQLDWCGFFAFTARRAPTPPTSTAG